MASSTLFLLSVLVISVSCRHLLVEDGTHRFYIGDMDNSEGLESSARVRRQAHGSFSLSSDGTAGAAVRIPMVHKGNNILSTIGSLGFNDQLKLGSATAGLALNNDNGNGLSLTGTHIPGFGNQVTAAGTVNLLHTDTHDLSANAFGTRSMPTIPNVPDFNTVGGGLDYMFKDKVGASISASHRDLDNRNTYNLDGKLNLFRSPSTSVDFSAGLQKFVTPFMRSGWKPNISTFRTLYSVRLCPKPRAL